MRAMIVVLVSIIIVIGAGLGVTHVVNPDLTESMMNKISKTKVLSIHDAYQDPTKASRLEEELYAHYDGSVVPLFYRENELSRIQYLDPLAFGDLDPSSIEEQIKNSFQSHPPKPFLLRSNPEGKELCFLTASDARDNVSKAPHYYQVSKCKLSFEKFKELTASIILEQDILDAVYEYKSFYNQKQDAEEMADETIYQYYYNVYAGIDAALQAMKKGDGLSDITNYLRQKEKSVDAPSYIVNDYDKPFTMRLIREVQSGNMPQDIDSLKAFEIIYDDLKSTVPHYTLISLIMNQKEIEDRGNFARKGILESAEFKLIKSIN